MGGGGKCNVDVTQVCVDFKSVHVLLSCLFQIYCSYSVVSWEKSHVFQVSLILSLSLPLCPPLGKGSSLLLLSSDRPERSAASSIVTPVTLQNLLAADVSITLKSECP